MRPLHATVALLLAACAGEDLDVADTEDSGDSEAAVDAACRLDEVPVGTICTVVGRMGIAAQSVDGLPATDSELYLPVDMTMGPDGLLYLVDWNNHRVRRVEPDGTLKTLAGTGFLGDGPEGDALGASFNHPTNLKFLPSDPTKLYIAAWHNSRIELLDLAAGTIRFECGDGQRAYSGDGGPASVAELDLPASLEFLPDDTMIIADAANQIIRVVDHDGIIRTVAGTPPPGLLPNGQTDRQFGWEGDGGPAKDARFNFGWGQKSYPTGRIELDGRKLYVADSSNFVVRVLDLDTGTVDHVAGTGLTPGYAGDGGPAAEAKLDFPTDVAADGQGNLYIADTYNSCVRKVDADGIITTVAGVCSQAGSDGDGGPATEAHLFDPYGVEVAGGVLYVADTENHVIRAVRLE